LYKNEKFSKAEKIYERMNTFFKSKDPKTNYTEEDETSEDYINGIKCLEDL
jgi:hypothetical protein